MSDWNDSDWPRFLIGDTETRTFVVHLHRPRFVAEVVRRGPDTEGMQPTFIDTIDSMDAAAIARLMREAGDWYVRQIEKE